MPIGSATDGKAAEPVSNQASEKHCEHRCQIGGGRQARSQAALAIDGLDKFVQIARAAPVRRVVWRGEGFTARAESGTS